MSVSDSRERFFDAGQEILATEGYGSLKLAAVCQALDVTTGAFYHSFTNWSDFTSELLENWRRERTTLIAEVARSAGDPVKQLQSLLAATLELRHGSEAAIRIWAAVDPAVAADCAAATLLWPGAALLLPCDSPLLPCGSALLPCAAGVGEATGRDGATPCGAAAPA